jgi:eukaryotic-like serine/threonine-protein kinase
MSQDANSFSDLLLGLFALKNGQIAPAQLVSAFDVWMRAGGRRMAEILIERGALDERGRALLDVLVAAHVKLLATSSSETPESSGDPESSATVPSATIAYVGSTPPGSVDKRDFPRSNAEGERFRILRPHARGGLGEVFVALDPELNREVALKELQAKLAYDTVSQTRFLQEAEVTGRLEHPGVVPVYGLGRYADGRPYYAMRFIEGETLKIAIEKFHGGDATARSPGDPQLVFRRLLRSIIDTCNAVAYAHSRGVVHRDLKPENIMLGRFGETLVLDWGMAKPLSAVESKVEDASTMSRLADDASLTVQGSIVGTPQYMSPEQALGDWIRVGPASDIYSLGATLYCLLVGRSPFSDGDVRGVLERVRRGIFAAPRRLRRTVDPALEGICLKAMSQKPEDRHASALALAADLEAWLADVRYRGEQELALNQVKRSLSHLCLERAQNLFGREMHAEGMLWLARALENVPPDSPSLDRVIRASLSGWHIGAKLMERSLAHRGAVHAVALSPDGRRLATACEDHQARLWDVATSSQLSRPMAHDGPVLAIAFSPDGKVLATAGHDGALRRWDALTGEPIGSPLPHGGPVIVLRFSPEGSLIATISGTGAPRIWNASTGHAIGRASGQGTQILALTFHPDGTQVATSDSTGQVRFWQTATGKPLSKTLTHERAVNALEFSPDGRKLLTGCLDGSARLWDLESGAPLVEFNHATELVCVRFNPGGSAIATACVDGTARLWDAATGNPIGETLSHRGRVDCLEFSQDGTIIASGSRDGTVRLWDAATALPIGPALAHPSEVLSMVLSSDSQRIATGCSDGIARCWKVPLPVTGDAERISCWVRVSTGLDFDPGDAIRRLDDLTSWELRRRLYDLGGPPIKGG